MAKYQVQTASDIQRDGLGVELLDESGNVIAEVFRCDCDKSLTFHTFDDKIPFVQVEKLILVARQKLGAFADGASLPAVAD